MKNNEYKEICNYIEFVHVSKVEKINKGLEGDEVIFKEGGNFTFLPIKDKISYSSKTQTPAGGPIKTQTVTITTDTKTLQDLTNALKYYIIRLNQDNGFIIGNLDYPVQKVTTQPERKKTTITFKQVEPL